MVTRSGLPLGHEVFARNQSEPMTLEGMMTKMEALDGRASRIWVFDRGVASEKNLDLLRRSGSTSSCRCSTGESCGCGA